MTYIPSLLLSNEDEAFKLWAKREFERVQEALQEFDFLLLQELHEAPKKLKKGMIVLADGTNWNPGAGAGVYSYYGGVWNRLG